MKRLLYTLLLILSVSELFAQYAYFPTSGTITFERKFHVQNYLKRTFGSKVNLEVWDKLMVDNITKNGPTEMVTNHTLKFYGQESLFETVKEDYPTNYRNANEFLPFLSDTKTYINCDKGLFNKLLVFGDDELLMADTIPYVKWKYTDEYRNIAGYDCRRANGVIQDSIYVVAFFTNQIDIPTGPELIQGLPGAILGVSLPSLNINMFATKVELHNEPVSATLTKRKKIQPESKAAISKKLRETIYDWVDEKEFQKRMSKVFF